MTISLSAQQLKSAGIHDSSGGFLFVKVLKESGKGLYQIQLNGQLLTVKSGQPLPLGSTLKVQLQPRGKSESPLLLFSLHSDNKITNEKTASFLSAKGEGLFSLFATTPSENETLSFFLKRLAANGVFDLENLPLALKRLHEKYSKRQSLYVKEESHPFLKSAMAVAFAQKGLVVTDSAADSFIELLFGFDLPKHRKEKESLSFLFNHSRNLLGLQWWVIPFSFEEGEKRWGGSFTVGVEKIAPSEGEGQLLFSNLGKSRYFTINSSIEGIVYSIHFDLPKKRFFFYGEGFVSSLQKRRAIEALLIKRGFSLAFERVLLPQQFDGFERVVLGEDWDEKSDCTQV